MWLMLWETIWWSQWNKKNGKIYDDYGSMQLAYETYACDFALKCRSWLIVQYVEFLLELLSGKEIR